MAVRKRKKVASKKARKVVKKRAKISKTEGVKARDYNRKALWKAYRELQLRAEKAWEKFRTDVKKNAKRDILIKDHNHLLLLLGECDYMARECMRMAAQTKKSR